MQVRALQAGACTLLGLPLRAPLSPQSALLLPLPMHRAKYYNNCIFHNVQQNFLVQTGDPTGKGKGGSSIYGCDLVSLYLNVCISVSESASIDRTHQQGGAAWLSLQRQVLPSYADGASFCMLACHQAHLAVHLSAVSPVWSLLGLLKFSELAALAAHCASEGGRLQSLAVDATYVHSYSNFCLSRQRQRRK